MRNKFLFFFFFLFEKNHFIQTKQPEKSGLHMSIWESQKMGKKKYGTHKRWALQLNQYSNEQNMKSRHEGASLHHNLGFQLFPFQFHLHHYHEHHLFLHSIQISATLSLTVTVIYFFFCFSLYIFWYFHSLLLFLPQYHSKYTYKIRKEKQQNFFLKNLCWQNMNLTV